MRWDPRVLLVDARERRFAPGAPLDNPFFSWIRIATRDEAQCLAADISGRHLIIVHEDEERALDLDHVFKSLELHSSALEAGEHGWREAIVEEDVEMFGDTLVVTLNRLALNKRQYIFVRGRARWPFSRRDRLRLCAKKCATREQNSKPFSTYGTTAPTGRRLRGCLEFRTSTHRLKREE